MVNPWYICKNFTTFPIYSPMTNFHTSHMCKLCVVAVWPSLENQYRQTPPQQAEGKLQLSRATTAAKDWRGSDAPHDCWNTACRVQEQNKPVFELWFLAHIKEPDSNATCCKASHLQDRSWQAWEKCTKKGSDRCWNNTHTQSHTHLMLVMLPVSEPSLHLSSWLATICRSASSSLVRRSNCSSCGEERMCHNMCQFIYCHIYSCSEHRFGFADADLFVIAGK